MNKGLFAVKVLELYCNCIILYEQKHSDGWAEIVKSL